MKTLLLAGALAIGSITSFAHTTTNESNTLSYRATQNLYSLYGQLENVEWRKSINNMIRADFVEDETSYAVFFTADGEFLAETKKVTRIDLPLALRKTTDQKFKEAKVIESLELINAEEHVWFFKTESEGKTKIWKGYNTGLIEVYLKN